MNKSVLTLLIFIFLTGCATGTSQAMNAQDSPSAYIENKGSDTMVNLALAWAERYRQINPQISLSVTGGGTGTGLAALANGTVDIANASRAIKPEEVKQVKERGVDPTEFIVARDAIAVIVNPANSVEKLTLQQISDIYQGKINNWKDLGGDNRPIVRLSRETNSGTHVYFLEQVIRLGDTKNKSFFSSDTLLLPSSEGITSEVRDNPNAIGYDGLGYVIPEVKVLAIAKSEKGDYVLPSADSVNAKTYPIARDLYMYTLGQPKDGTRDYLNWIVTPEGQAIVGQLGFVPIKPPQ